VAAELSSQDSPPAGAFPGTAIRVRRLLGLPVAVTDYAQVLDWIDERVVAARVRRAAAAVEIRCGCGGGHALEARSDRHRDHVLFQPLVVADPGIAAGCLTNPDGTPQAGFSEMIRAGPGRRDHSIRLRP